MSPLLSFAYRIYSHLNDICQIVVGEHRHEAVPEIIGK